MAQQRGSHVADKVVAAAGIWPLVAALIGTLCLLPVSVASEVEAKPEWLGSRAGVSDEILPPWTPLEVAADEVAAWGRTYRFGGLPFPNSVVSRETELLASPIVLTGRADGKELVWTGPGPETLESKPHVVRLTTRADSETVRCEGTVTVECDGMVRCDFRLVPKGDRLSVDKLTLKIPIRPQYARYLHFWPGRWGSCFNSTALPEEGYRGAFKPFVWLGDEWRGLAWFSESDRNFFNKEPD
ncbi:MAG: glycoside hydrolase domain-containing protein [Planctomycetota bacterium]